MVLPCVMRAAHTVRGARDVLGGTVMHPDSDITLQCFTYGVGLSLDVIRYRRAT